MQSKDYLFSETLFQAVECSHEECVNLLLDYKAEVDIKDSDNNTALHIAVKEGNTNIVNLLLKAGAEVNVKNKVHTLLYLLEKAKHD